MTAITLHQLRRVLKGDGFSVVFQPVVDLRKGVTVGYEALSRFATEAAHAPADWFADGRDRGLGVELEAMAVNLAVEEMRRHDGEGFVAVNVNADTLVQPAFGGALPGDLKGVVFEISEYSAIFSPEVIGPVVRAIRGRGGGIAIDDVAGSNATLRQLLDLDCDQIKLDMDLVRRAPTESRTRALVRGLAAFAQDAGLIMVAKGIEQPMERDMAIELGIPWAQGYFLGRPATWPVGPTAASPEPVAQPARA